jgi:hypothetical protein
MRITVLWGYWAMIQFNLLPDVKLEYIKTRRTKRMVISVSLLVSGIALFVFLFLLVTVDILQKKNISDLSSDIKTNSHKLEGTADINKILTIQNQLTSLPSMHDSKVVSSRIFNYIQSITPAEATISDLKVDFTTNSLVVTGGAPVLTVVNTFTDTLKFTNYKVAGRTDTPKAFSSVVLSGFSRGATTANYTITASFDPAIFSNQNDVSLVIPTESTTRSQVDQPGLFTGSNTSTGTTKKATN